MSNETEPYHCVKKHETVSENGQDWEVENEIFGGLAIPCSQTVEARQNPLLPIKSTKKKTKNFTFIFPCRF